MLGPVPFGLASIMFGMTVIGLLTNPLIPAAGAVAAGATPKGLVGIVGRGFIIIGGAADMKGIEAVGAAAFGMSIGPWIG